MKILALAALALSLAGCANKDAFRPFAHVDAQGYSVGVAGSWRAVAVETAKAVGLSDGKAIVR